MSTLRPQLFADLLSLRPGIILLITGPRAGDFAQSEPLFELVDATTPWSIGLLCCTDPQGTFWSHARPEDLRRIAEWPDLVIVRASSMTEEMLAVSDIWVQETLEGWRIGRHAPPDSWLTPIEPPSSSLPRRAELPVKSPGTRAKTRVAAASPARSGLAMSVPRPRVPLPGGSSSSGGSGRSGGN